MFIDSHCHLEMESYIKDREHVIKRAQDGGISYILTVGTEEKYFNIVSELTKKYNDIYGAIGIHPHNSSQFNHNTEKKIRDYLKSHRKIVAYGEIGLDFFKNYSPHDIQKEVFIHQIHIAKELNLPIIIHSRAAEEDTLKILKETGVSRGVIHCFSYNKEYAKKFLNLGFYISIPGTITFSKKQESIDVVKYIPLDRLLAETDAPFLTPEPHRGKRNEPLYVKYTVEAIARIRNEDLEKLKYAIYKNFIDLFLGGQLF
ncbi:MAG: TatD family hydrolase [Syntrophorhabdaceae bacterium]|nr:TatD family hydrolase [Syntrophorhabdaceae bacterium]